MLKGILVINGGEEQELNMNQVQKLRNFLKVDMHLDSVEPATRLSLRVVDDPPPSPGKAAYEAFFGIDGFPSLRTGHGWRDLDDESRRGWEMIARAARDFGQ